MHGCHMLGDCVLHRYCCGGANGIERGLLGVTLWLSGYLLHWNVSSTWEVQGKQWC